MGLQSSLTTALTGLQAAETTIDVTGNNVANSNTVGFKESEVLFATQFLRTLSIGSAPSQQLGGTNPRQIGLGVKVASINTNFTQGTIEISANPLDIAIQGDGFLVVQGAQGNELYTRAGQLNINASNEIVTPSGTRVLGYGVDDEFNIDQSALAPISIPVGASAVAQQTENAFFTGFLDPQAKEGLVPEIIRSQILGDASIEGPPADSWTLSDLDELPPSSVGSLNLVENAGSGIVDAGTYRYRVVFANQALGGETNPAIIRLQEGAASIASTEITVGANAEIQLSSIQQPTNSHFSHIRLYRTDLSGTGEYRFVGEIPSGTTTFNDSVDDAAWQAQSVTLDDTTLIGGNYSYYVTYYNTADGSESRPTPQVGAVAISEDDRRILLNNLPQPNSDETDGDWDAIRVYRNLANDSSSFHLVDTLTTPQTTYIDSKQDAEISTNPQIDLDGPRLNPGTFVKDIMIRDGANFSQPFANLGTITFQGRRDGRSLAPQEFTLTDTTTVNELVTFMQESLGIQQSSALIDEPFPDSVNGAGVIIDNGQIQVTSNHGLENALSIGLTAFQLREPGASTSSSVAFNFSQTQPAIGEGATADLIVYDSLGIPIRVSVTTVLENKTSDETTYRWFATSPDNEPLTGFSRAVGNGILRFDNAGNLLPGDTPTIAIDRNATASASPVEIGLDFSEVTSLPPINGGDSSLSVTRQDGFPPGVLTSFVVSESGLIKGIFSNGTERDLGQLVMARFNNNTGLQAIGDNMFAAGGNSGEAVIGLPGSGGLGSLLGGAVELSNTDIGRNLIELILASTQYRGNARVITTAQELLDELLALRR